MESILRKVIEGRGDEETHRYFVRFGKGDYKRRFLIKFNKGKKIKIRGSFEWANDFVAFVKENKDVLFSGKVFMPDKIPGLEGKKKGKSFVYEIEESSIEEFENAYVYLLNVNSDDIVLKIKKSLPKPGKNEEKIDDKFCSLDLDLKYWEKVREVFFWDISDCKKCEIEHELRISDIEMPSGVEDPEKIRELAKRKGKIIRKITCDGKEQEKESELIA
tara:strand:- start:1460 stop:2113 length:654 start_codon:yes stop_codon:yes gene_type:complete